MIPLVGFIVLLDGMVHASVADTGVAADTRH